MRRVAPFGLIRIGLVLTAGLLGLAGCADTTRVATLNLEAPGTSVATSLQHHLAAIGHPGARVICARTLVINVGTIDTCHVTGAGANTRVLYSFRNYTGNSIQLR